MSMHTRILKMKVILKHLKGKAKMYHVILVYILLFLRHLQQHWCFCSNFVLIRHYL